MIGKTISHYKILEKLGEGGMGIVYKAEDTKLKRTVALKFLPPELTRDPEAKQRFIQEAQAASALQNNNVATIHEINETEDGQLFICMDCYEGETLKNKIKDQRLKIKEAIDIAIQIAEGLKKAHEKGIVHRDIKPANIFITEDGVAKILDFGLAKLAGPTQLTKDTSTLGTVAYMSPEQLSGKEIDQRTDIWSLGVVLFEMLTAEQPFKGDYEQAVIYSIINQEPKPISDLELDVPEEMKKIIDKALAKEPSQRYQHVDELIEDLSKIKKNTISQKYMYPKGKTKKAKQSIGLGIILMAVIIIAGYFILWESKTKEPIEKSISESQWKNSVAVLPFRDFSPRKDQEYFCDGMTDAIIGKLSQLKQLKIISLTSVLQYKNQVRNIKKIGQELDVEIILEGSIQKEGNHIRINVQLINVADDSHLWQDTYDRELKSLFTIQDEISRSIANALKIELLEEEKELLLQQHTQNMDAYQLYMQGRFFWRKRSREGYKKSIEFYTQALEADPDYALAYAGLADTYSVMAWSRYLPKKEGFTKAKTAAFKALELDDNLAEAHNSLAYILLDYEWKFEQAKQEFERAIQLNPGYANAYHWYSRYFVYHGDLEQAVHLLKQALELDPLSPSIHYYLGGVYGIDGQYDEALSIIKKALDIHPDFSPLYDMLGIVYCEKSMFIDALKAFKEISEPSTILREYFILYIELKKGNIAGLEGFIKKLEKSGKLDDWSPTLIAELYWLTDHKEKCYEWLEKAVEKRDSRILYLKVLDMPLQYRTDPRFKELLKKIGLDK